MRVMKILAASAAVSLAATGAMAGSSWHKDHGYKSHGHYGHHGYVPAKSPWKVSIPFNEVDANGDDKIGYKEAAWAYGWDGAKKLFDTDHNHDGYVTLKELARGGRLVDHYGEVIYHWPKKDKMAHHMKTDYPGSDR